MGDKNYQMGFASNLSTGINNGVTRMRLGLEGTKKFENMHEKIQELGIELEHSIPARVLINEIDTLGCVVGHYSI